MTTRLVVVTTDNTLRDVQALFIRHQFHHLLVLEAERLVGVVSDRDLLRHVSPFVGRPLAERSQDLATLDRRVHQIMSRRLITAGPDTPLVNAIEKLLDHGISCLPVVDEQQRPAGIVTWHDILLYLIGGKERAPEVPQPPDPIP